MARVAERTADYWTEFEGIPLCHVARTDQERRALTEKGVCGLDC